MKLDVIRRGDARWMRDVENESVHLVVTSPPYNARKKYDHWRDDLSWNEYFDFLRGVWTECQRVLVPGGRLAINVAGVGRQPYVPLHAFILQQLLDLGFLLRGEIVWQKGRSAGASTNWGSFASKRNPVLRDTHEYVVVASKDTYALDGGLETDITNDEFCDATRSVWYINASREIESEQHPATFPVELPVRLIKLFSGVGDIVLDPFMGSGSTAIAAKLTQRHYLGFDVSPNYVALARQRVRAAIFES